MSILLVGMGSAIGGMTRFWVSNWMALRWGDRFPWGTLFVNVTGSVLIGLLAALSAGSGRWQIGTEARVFFMVGVLGGYTTFSAFSLQTLLLAQSGQWLFAVANAAGSVVLCLGAVWIGHALGRFLLP